MPRPPKRIASKAAASRFLPLEVERPIRRGPGNCRTPHFGQISALALIIEPQLVQYFSSATLITGGGETDIKSLILEKTFGHWVLQHLYDTQIPLRL